MKATKTSAAVAPQTKKRMPDMTGVPGEIVSIEGLTLDFGTHRRQSPYDPLLDQLAEAGAGKAIIFTDARARTAVQARAKKKGMRVSFAEKGGLLYVRLDGSVEADLKSTRREQIRHALKLSALTPMQLAAALRAKGDASIDAQLVEAILAQMQRAGDVVRGEGDAWRLNPTKRAA